MFFSRDLLFADGTVKRSDLKAEAKAYSFADQREISICPEPASDIVHLSEGPLGQIFIASFDSTKEILKIFTKDAGQCELKNSLPAANYNALNVSVSPDNKKVLLKMKSTNGRDSLAFVRLDGTPTYMVDTPLFSTGTIISAQFLKDSFSIFYFGQQLRPIETNAFLWTLQN